MAGSPNVVVRNQFVYLMDNATINVFDCVDTRTGQRDIYYIQKGRIDGTATFRQTQRSTHSSNFNQRPAWRPPPQDASSSDSSDDETTTPSSGNRNSANASYMSSDKYIDILASRRPVTDDELQKVADKLRFEDEKYKKLATFLNVNHEDLERIRREKDRQDKSEMIFTLLKFWKANSPEPTVGKVGDALEKSGLQKFVTETLEP